MGQPPPVLEYRDRAADRIRWRDLGPSLVASAVVGVCGVIGLAFGRLGTHGWAEVLILPIYLGGIVYVVARILESRAPRSLKLIKVLSAGTATAIAPFVMSGSETPLDYAVYGWFSEKAFGHPLVLCLAGALMTFLMADVADMVIRWRGRQTVDHH